MKIFQGDELPQPKSMLQVLFFFLTSRQKHTSRHAAFYFVNNQWSSCEIEGDVEIHNSKVPLGKSLFMPLGI